MPTKRSTPKKNASKKETENTEMVSINVKTIEAKDVSVTYLKKAFKFSEARKIPTIHKRKVIPKVKRGKKMDDPNPTMAMSFEEERPRTSRGGTAPLAASDVITFSKNIQLDDIATADTASHVCEPSAAINGNVIFYTGNWFACFSKNGGTTFSYIDPYSTFPNPIGMTFCCDQVVHYIKSIDTFVWLLQYGQSASGRNILRVAYAKTAAVKTGNWKYFDFSPSSIGLGASTWLDFPDLSTGKNMLYMTSNNFDINDNWVAAVVVRIKLSSFSSNVLAANSFKSNTYASFRVAQNCDTTAYFATHKSNSALRIFSWKEADAAPTTNDVNVASWSSSGYSSVTPDGRNWLKRADGRLTGATRVGSEIWFAWGASKGGANNRPHAYVQIARINATNMTLIQNINLWNANSAMMYAALSTNSLNEVGASFMYGGGTKFPTNMVSILTGTRRQKTTFAGQRGPIDNKWGDYLTVRRNYPNEKLFFATGYVLKNGAGNSDATPNLTVFGRSSDV